ncbi:hypothetical protein EDB89DRAFT_2029564 [Lactarius sanguifluus]|nr:hypothetical protein EDB89DRAFT_2029564 [Lactarius sanguifluus]
MQHKCIDCNRSFRSSVSLDKHRCWGPMKMTSTSTPSATVSRRRTELSPPRRPKRARITSRHADEDAPAEQGLDDYDHPGPAYSPPPGMTPPPVRSARSGRVVRMPQRLMDYVPHGDMSLAHVPPRAPTPPEHEDRTTSPPIAATPPPSTHPHPHPHQTQTNNLGVFRRYTHPPTWHPKHEERMDLICDSPIIDIPPPVPTEAVHEISDDTPNPDPFAPFSNYSTAIFMAAYFSGSDTKSMEHANLLAEAMNDPRFRLDELKGFSAQRENTRMDKYLKDEVHPFQRQDGWQEASIEIRLPIEGSRFNTEDDAPSLRIHQLYHRRITDIIRAVCSSKGAESFEFTPYTMHWCPDPDDPHKYERVYADTYSSDTMIQAQTEVDNLPRLDGDTTERVAIGLMLASDSARLTNFGIATVWPIYLMFANQPKQERVRPSCRAVHHLAYVPSLGQDFASRYQITMGKAPSPDVELHCKRELMQGVWKHLMDTDFVEGCTNGLLIRCSDGVERNFFIRLISYSADYPEKVLLATIKNLGRAPCPRCLIQMKEIHGVATPSDVRIRNRLRIDNERRRERVERARKLIFEKGHAISGAPVQRILGDHSMIPTRNAFSDKLSMVGQDYHGLFVVDLLHEFEIGIWKSVLTHLIRMLYAIPRGHDRVAILDARFHSIPTFGRDTIRKFPGNISGLSKLAARDYEDILQCSIPAFDGLYREEDNRSINELLFLLATWHAYAKLRLHTDTTLEMFQTVGTTLCQALRHFASVTCPRYATKELPREANARVARQRKGATRSNAESQSTGNARTGKERTGKQFNMSTYKIHCIPDYVPAIRKYGTTDSYSTQTSELAHRLSKMWYRSSNKNRDFIRQVANKESRTRFYATMLEVLAQGQSPSTPATLFTNSCERPNSRDEEATPNNPSVRYQMSKSSATSRDLTWWLLENQDDRALRNFRPRLIDHLLARIKGQPYTGDEHDFTSLDRDNIVIDQNRMYEHKTIRFKSTTYDARRMEESANPRTHADVIVLSHEDGSEGRLAFPYWHARIIGIYHFLVRERTNGATGLTLPSRMDVLFVRWFGLDSDEGQSGWHARQMHKVGFLPDTNVHGPRVWFSRPERSHKDGAPDTRLLFHPYQGSIDREIYCRSDPPSGWRVPCLLCCNVF